MIIYLSILFIYSNIYYLLNYKRLDKRFHERDKNSKLDLIYYITKLLFFIWILSGLILKKNWFFILMISMIIIKIPIYYLNKKWYNLFYRITPPIQILIMLIYLYIELF
jgi:hypothetical protein